MAAADSPTALNQAGKLFCNALQLSFLWLVLSLVARRRCCSSCWSVGPVGVLVRPSESWRPPAAPAAACPIVPAPVLQSNAQIKPLVMPNATADIGGTAALPKCCQRARGYRCNWHLAFPKYPAKMTALTATCAPRSTPTFSPGPIPPVRREWRWLRPWLLPAPEPQHSPRTRACSCADSLKQPQPLLLWRCLRCPCKAAPEAGPLLALQLPPLPRAAAASFERDRSAAAPFQPTHQARRHSSSRPWESLCQCPPPRAPTKQVAARTWLKRPVLWSFCLFRNQSGILYARGFATMPIMRSSSSAEHSPVTRSLPV